MLTYNFTYKKQNGLFWKTEKVIGHGHEYVDEYSYDEELNRFIVTNKIPNTNSMVIYYPDGSLKRIPNWNEFELKLGTDWKLFQKKQLEKESGQKVDLGI